MSEDVIEQAMEQLVESALNDVLELETELQSRTPIHVPRSPCTSETDLPEGMERFEVLNAERTGNDSVVMHTGSEMLEKFNEPIFSEPMNILKRKCDLSGEPITLIPTAGVK